jgi:hypothetical protein
MPAGLRPIASLLALGLAVFACALGVSLTASGGGSQRETTGPVGSLAVPLERQASATHDLSPAARSALPSPGRPDALPALAAGDPEPAPAVIAPTPEVSKPRPAPRASAPVRRAPVVPASPRPAPAPAPEPVAPPPPPPEPAPEAAPAPPAAAPQAPPVDFDDSG